MNNDYNININKQKNESEKQTLWKFISICLKSSSSMLLLSLLLSSIKGNK